MTLDRIAWTFQGPVLETGRWPVNITAVVRDLILNIAVDDMSKHGVKLIESEVKKLGLEGLCNGFIVYGGSYAGARDDKPRADYYISLVTYDVVPMEYFLAFVLTTPLVVETNF